MKQEDYFHMILLWSIFQMIQIIVLVGYYQISKESERERKKDVNTYVKDRQKKIEKKRKRKGEVNATKTNKKTKS